MPRRLFVWMLLAGVACKGEPSPAPAATPEPRPEPRAPLLEDEDGVIGGPFDPTDFEFEPEVEDGVPPRLDGTPPVPDELARALAPYLDARRVKLAGTTPDGNQMLVLGRSGTTTQAMLLTEPGATPRPLTFGSEPVVQASFVPGHPDALLFRRDVAGNEDHQLFHLDVTRGIETLLTDGESRHGPFRVLATPDPGVLFTGNARSEADMDLYRSDARRPPAALVEKLDGQWILLSVRAAGEEALMRRFWSVDRSRIARLDLATGTSSPLPGADEDEETAVSYLDARHLAGGGYIVQTDRGGDTVGLYTVGPEGKWTALTPPSAWDVESFAVLGGGRIVYTLNEDGRNRMFLLDPANGGPRELDLPRGGVLTGLRNAGPDRVSFTASSAVQPADLYTLDVQRGDLVRWTHSPTGADPTSFVHPRVARVPSSDAVAVPVFVYSPPGPGPFPTLLWMHGGPEDQFRPDFNPMLQYFVSRGIAVIGPNIRGSDGYGRTYRGLDDGIHRGGSVEDVGAILDWIANEPALDGERVGIYGGSYGGFMVLASLVAYPDRLVAGCDMVGIANLVTFLENTRGYRRDLRRAEYGDERDPKVRAVLEQLSPIHGVERIRAPLFVAHGANDPRVPPTEAEQIVAAVRAHQREVWYMLAPTEGHSFRKAINRDTFYVLMATFFERYLVEARAQPDTEE